MRNSTDGEQVTQPSQRSQAWRDALFAVGAAAAPAPKRLAYDREGASRELAMTLASIADLQAWLLALGHPETDVELEPQTRYGRRGVLGTARAALCGLRWDLTAWDPDPDDPGDGERQAAADVPDECEQAPPSLDDVVDLADAALLDEREPAPVAALVDEAAGDSPDQEWGGEHRPDPAERIAAVAAAAPVFVRPVAVVNAVVEAAEAAARRSARWSEVTAAVAAGVPAPTSVTVSEDGWRLDVVVVDEAAVYGWAAQLGLDAPPGPRVFARRGRVYQELSAEQSHPYAVHVSATKALDVHLPRPRPAEQSASPALPPARPFAVAA